MNIGIIDYGVGNIYSLQKAFMRIGLDSIVTRDKKALNGCRGIVLPGVGAFCDASEKLSGSGLDEVILAQAGKGKLVVGICLGMQLLFDYSTEGGLFKGLGLISGWVDRISGGVKVPHMGWNTLQRKSQCKVLEGIKEDAYVYYVHSYYARADESADICAVSSYGVDVPAVVQKNNILGLQFHPEKSGETGLTILNNIKEMLI